MKLYLLGERSGTFIPLPNGKATKVLEFLTVESPGGSGIAMFASPLDAEICRHYLNRQNHRGRKNEYELVTHSDIEVKTMIRTHRHCGRLIAGFATDAAGMLVIQEGVHSLAHMNLLPADMAWLFEGAPEPKQSAAKTLYETFVNLNAADYLDELEKLGALDQEALTDLAELAVSRIGVKARGNGQGFSVFSIYEKKWRRLV